MPNSLYGCLYYPILFLDLFSLNLSASLNVNIMQRDARLPKELVMLLKNPPPKIQCYQDETNKYLLHAQITGPEDSGYKGGVFHVNVDLPEKYPFEPPKVKFLTPIYHPNIDDDGRICLDTLKMPPGPPQGAWRPSLNISSVLITILLLLSEPNPEDPLMPDIARELKLNKSLFLKKSKDWTKKFAIKSEPYVKIIKCDSVPTKKRLSENNKPINITKRPKLKNW